MLKDKRLFLLDIDGTVCLGTKFIEGAYNFLTDIVKAGGKFVFVTNNTTKSIEDYINFFKALGLKTDSSNFITASYVTIKFLRENYKDRLIYVLGTASFISELENNGINVTTDCNAENISCVLAAYNNELTYQGVWDTCKLLSTKAVDYLATNPDMVCPVEFGFVPDCGSICQMIENAVNKTPAFIGKPHTAMADIAIEQTGFTKEQTLVVGDRMYTDILCGCNAGVETALVLTGEAKQKDLQNYSYKPDYVFENIKELHCKWSNE